MVLKARISPLGGGENEIPLTNAWLYTTQTNNIKTLYFYNNTIGGEEVKVPTRKTELQDYYSSNTSYSTLPFFEHQNLKYVDLECVPFRNNSMSNAFRNCRNLTTVKHINKKVNNLSYTFLNCRNLNQNIQIPNSVKNMDSTFRYCEILNQNIQIPNSVTSMYGTFASCYNLNQNIQISNSVTNMYGTFEYCYNLNQNIQIPNSVTNMSTTFASCYNLNQNIQISNSVTNMSTTFAYCHNLNQNIQIPNSVKNMDSTFRYCEILNQNIQIPNSVVNMSFTFSMCNELNQNIQIPNSVTSMYGTFNCCHNLNQNIQIPNSVINMYNTFAYCNNIGTHNKWIDINTISITNGNINNAFYYTSAHNISNQLRIVYFMRYINNANTPTYTAMVNAGYAPGTGVGNTSANATEYRNLKIYDYIAGDWNSYAGNGTYWLLYKWNGGLTTERTGGVASTDITAPTSITTYDTFPTALNISTFTGNTIITSINVSESIPWVSTRTGWYTNSSSRGGAFKSCLNLTSVNVYINDSVLGMQETFMECRNLKTANVKLSNAGTHAFAFFYNCLNLRNAKTPGISSTLITDGMVKSSDIATGLNIGSVHIPDTVTNVQSFYGNCQSLDTILIDSTGVVAVHYLVESCNTRNLNVYIKSPLVTGITNYHKVYNANFATNTYIPYLYANGIYTATYNTFNAQAYMRNNSTSNHWLYDISPYNSLADYVVAVASPNINLTTYRGQSAYPVAPSVSPFSSSVATTLYHLKSTYTLNANLSTVNCNNVPFATCDYAFRNCFNITAINNFKILDTVTNCQSVFENCNKMLNNPASNTSSYATQAAYMYKGCTNLGVSTKQTISFGTNCINFRQTFNGCSNLWGDIWFYNWTTTTASNRWNGTFTGYNASRRRNIHCYFTYQNGVNTPIYNLLKGTALYNNNSTSNFYLYNIGTCPA